MRQRRFSVAGALLSIVTLAAVAVAAVPIGDQTLLGLPTAGGIFESGGTVALEIVGDGSSDLFVEGIALLCGDVVIHEETLDPRLGSELWLGRVPLIEPSGDRLPPGEYTIVVFTGDGSFLVTFSVVHDLASALASSPATPSSGPFVRAFRLLTETEIETETDLRVGDDLMIALEGNPTTGYAWADVTENPFPVLETTPGTDFLPDPESAGLVGGGGLFLFRYRAYAVGAQALRFDYARPWETGEPAETARFVVNVLE